MSEFFWFSFTLIYLLMFSTHIIEVTSAVWQPRRRLLSTVVLCLIVLYWFAVVAYVYYGDDFSAAVQGSDKSLRKTLAVIFDSWYKFDLGGFLADNGKSAIMDDDSNYELKEDRIAFDFIFFFIVPVLLLSIISGIIIDNFVDRRSHSDSISERQNDQCFICGTDSNDLPDFEKHYKFYHNIWDYMYYIGYLRVMNSKDLTDYRDIYVKNCLDNESNDWFPAYRDFVLQKVYQRQNDTQIACTPSDCLQTQFDMNKKSDPQNIQTQISELSANLRTLESNVDERMMTVESKFDSGLASLNSKISDIDAKLAKISSSLSDSRS